MLSLEAVATRVCPLILRALVAVILVGLRLQGGGVEEFEGKPLREVEFRPQAQPFQPDTLERILDLPRGQPLDIRQVSRAIVRLFASGRYEDIVVEAEPVDGGVRLTFRTSPAWFVGRVTVEGVPEPPNPGQLVNATQLSLGARYRPENVDAALDRLKEILRANGFYHPVFSTEFEDQPDLSQVNIRIGVEPGERARIGAPIFSGDAARPFSSLVRISGWRSWFGFGPYREATASRLQRGIDRLRAWYRNRDYLSARITLETLRRDETANRVMPVVRIDKGARVRIRTEGARVSRGKLRQLVPIFQERAVDTELLVEGTRNLTQYFQSKGYFEAKVDFERGQERDGAEAIRFLIDRGQRFKLVQIGFEGNSYFDDETLRERMLLRPARFFQVRWGRFSDELLRKDQEAIAELYRSNGFRDVKVDAEVEEGAGGKKDHIAVHIRIQEGPQWKVSGIEITGVDLRYYEQIRNLLESQPGQPYSDGAVARDRESILNFYYENGFPEARLEVQAQPGAAPHTMELHYAMNEGPRQFVRAVSIGGLRTTREELVNRRIALEVGDPLSLTAVAESQRRLYDLGIFAKVDAAVQNPDGRERNRNVLFQLEEAKRYSLDFGLGAELGRIGGGGATTLQSPGGATGFSPRLSLGVSRLNLFGIGHTASVNSQLSNIRRRAVVSYLAPQFQGNPDWNLQFTGLYDLARDVRTFTSRRSEGSAQLGQRISKATSVQYRISYRLVEVFEETLKIDPDLIPLYSQPVRVGSVGGSHIIDRRDDPIESRRGFFNTVDFGLSSRWLGSKASFSRVVWKNSTYHRITRQVTFARSLTFGWLYSIKGVNEQVDVPLPERYFGGGATSHRGFAENQAGPRDLKTGFPVGGRATLFNNFELRFPLAGDSLGGVLFHDAGNVYSSLEKISFRWRQHGMQDFDYMVQAVGFGIRYKTPVGPVRIDLAFAPNTPRFRGFEGTPDELRAGKGRITDQRLSRFQFQFSIGQTF